MSTVAMRRAAALGLGLALAMAGMAVADTVTADGDALASGSQTMVDLGDVSAGATVPVDVSFALACKGTSHVAAGTTIAVTVSDQSWPADGSATSTPGSITVPGAWPAPGDACPDPVPATTGGTPVHLELTAPTTTGSGYSFDFLFTADPGTGITNTIGFTASLNVVDAGPAPDTTAPVLTGMPDDMTVFTPGTSAEVTWTMPSATDDTDPDPQVACAPASGSSFDLGTTTVTCTATDAAGNAAHASFDVTVRQLSGAFGQPLDDGSTPALVGRLGRTIPLRLDVTAGDVAQGPDAIDAPALRLDRLASCEAGAGSLGSRSAGSFEWSDGAWHLNLATGDLTAGCWRLTATVDGTALARAVVQLADGADSPGQLSKAAGRPAR
jgi:hypothetical protein